ncbi:hypothetical protein [Rhizobium sp. PP-CC-3G-465]|uniref:hypothetical protein n=1 Tax=Rhizobium sp. PP-CC-3G-465 TaxID=2135648 RepID=UPI0010434889|nr:hypothetical protein C8J33_10314 [Rhizobium sp. PP-CC-3G-465]
MARRRRRSKGTSPWAVIAIVLLVGFVVAAMGGFLMLRMRAGETVVLDEDNCPVTGALSATVVLLDVTDPISEITRVDMKRQFQRAVAGVEKGGLVEVYTLTSDEGKLRRSYRGCNPGDKSSADAWTSNPRKIQQRWDEAFDKPLREMSDTIGTATESKTSPILAGIQRIVVESLSDMKIENRPKKLYVASDMMENTNAFSIYKSGADYEAFLKSTARDRFRTSLDGIDVKIWAFQREGSSKHKNLPEFWAKWVMSNGGNFDAYERLSGIE